MRLDDIERDLRGVVDKRVVYHIKRQEEKIIANELAIQECAKVLSSFVDVLTRIQAVSNHVAESMKRGLRKEDNDLVQSVMPHPDDD